jgi:hypothetical protein
MKKSENPKQLSSLLLVILALVAPVIAQQKQSQPSPKPAASPESAVRAPQTGLKEEEITFDTLLAARSYKVYGEVRMIGQLVRSNSFAELLEPARLLGAPPKEFAEIIEFLGEHAETLATSRVMFAAVPARPALPPGFVAVELASPQDALKLEPKLRAFLSSMSASTPNAPPAQSETNRTEENKAGAAPKQQLKPPARTPRPVFVKRVGNLLLSSDTSFTLKTLRPDKHLPLAVDPNFQKARSRFLSEALFVYYDVNLAPHARSTIHGEVAKQSAPAPEPHGKADKSPATTSRTAKPDQTPTPPAPESSKTVTEDLPPPGVIAIDPVIVPPDGRSSETAETAPESAAKGSKPSADGFLTALPMFGSFLFGSAPSWPEAVGLAAALEGDEVVVRAMLVNAHGAPGALIPFFSFLLPGPEIAPRASTLSPADTDLFVSVSLDAPRIYDALLKLMKSNYAPGEDSPRRESESVAFDNQIATFEQMLGFKIKEDLLGALGNEVALNVSFKSSDFGPNAGIQTSAGATPAPKAAQPGFALFISLNDKERVREMLPRVLEAIGLTAPGATPQTERRGQFEVTSYGPASLAFIDDFLVISTDIASLRWVADARENNQTLAANPAFKNSTAWQSSRMLGQLYLSNTFTARQEPFVQLDDKLQEFLTRFNPQPGPITHAALNDDAGFFHELHLPRDWVAMMIAGFTSERALSPMADNELRAVGALMNIRAAQANYKEGKGKGSYATHEQLVGENLIAKRRFENAEGYRIEITAAGDHFEVRATPTEYGKTGRQSFYLDESGIIRGADHNGQPATAADKPL